MNISFVILDITRTNGTERTTSLLANKFAEKGHKISIISIFKKNKNPGFEIKSNIKISFLCKEAYTHNTSKWKIFRQYLIAIAALKRYLKENATDVIIGQAFLACFFLWVTGNAPKAYACEHFKYGMYNKFIRSFRDYIYKRFIRVITLTNADATEFKKRNCKAVVIPNMISFPLTTCPFHLEQKRIISVGRLHAQKGYDLLLYSLQKPFQKHPDWSARIFGEGEDRKYLEKLCRSLSLDNQVDFAGFSSNVQKEYMQADFYIMSSRYEGFPMVLLEAISCGLPVISFDCPEGPAELLGNGAGYLVPPENTSALSDAICAMIENPGMRAEYAQRGLERAKMYTPDKIYEKWMKLFMLT